MVRNAHVHLAVNIGITQQMNVIPSINIVHFVILQLLIVVMPMLHCIVYQLVKVLNVHIMLQLVQHHVIVLMELIGMVDHVLRKKLAMPRVFGIVNVILLLVYNV
jgi:hypothetical protein